MKIIIVDDEVEILTIIQLGFNARRIRSEHRHQRRFGFAVIGATETGSHAVLDVMMPDMDGYDLVQAIRRRSNMPLLMR